MSFPNFLSHRRNTGIDQHGIGGEFSPPLTRTPHTLPS
jgi:hypothetical protein